MSLIKVVFNLNNSKESSFRHSHDDGHIGIMYRALF